MQRFRLALSQSVHGLVLIDVRLLRLQPRLGGICRDPRPLAFETHADGQLIFSDLRQLLGDVGADAFLVQLVVDLMLELGLFVVAAHSSFHRLLIHQLAVDLYLQIRVIRFGSF